MDVNKSRMAGISSLVLLLSFFLPWSSLSPSVFSLVVSGLGNGYYLEGIGPAFELLRSVAIFGLAIYVCFTGLVQGRCQKQIVLALAGLVIFDNAFIIFQYGILGGAPLSIFFEGMHFGQALNYIGALALIGIAVWRSGSGSEKAGNQVLQARETPVHSESNNNVLPGVATALMLASFLMPWVSFRGVSTTLLDAVGEVFRKGQLDRAPAEVIIALVAFGVATLLALLVTYQAFISKAVSKVAILCLGILGLLIVAVAGVQASNAIGQFGGLVKFNQIFEVIGIGVYLFLACSVWLTWLGALAPAQRSQIG
jgi:hypothetical protein